MIRNIQYGDPDLEQPEGYPERYPDYYSDYHYRSNARNEPGSDIRNDIAILEQKVRNVRNTHRIWRSECPGVFRDYFPGFPGHSIRTSVENFMACEKEKFMGFDPFRGLENDDDDDNDDDDERSLEVTARSKSLRKSSRPRLKRMKSARNLTRKKKTNQLMLTRPERRASGIGNRKSRFRLRYLKPNIGLVDKWSDWRRSWRSWLPWNINWRRWAIFGYF